MQLSIAQLNREIVKLEAEASSDHRQADRMEAQAAYAESSDAGVALVGHQAANKFERNAQEREAQSAEYKRQIAELEHKVHALESERQQVQARLTEIDREIINLKG